MKCCSKHRGVNKNNKTVKKGLVQVSGGEEKIALSSCNKESTRNNRE